ncbi:MAG: TIGR01244 family phosphatase [Gammaproteobacteria bacterium]|nr:TIGR01244 family phosphatase [Gammaproteobacteria bacterium]
MQQLYNNIYVSGQINPQDFPALQEAGIKVIINNRPDGEEPGQLDSAAAAELAQQHGMQYHYLPMANGQPLPDNLVADFKAVVDSGDDKVLAHCRSGMRSSVLWALGQVAEGQVTVDEAIEAGQGAGIPLHNARPMLEAAR